MKQVLLLEAWESSKRKKGVLNRRFSLRKESDTC